MVGFRRLGAVVFHVADLGANANLNTVDRLGYYQALDVVNGPTSGHIFIHVTATNVAGLSRAVQKAWDLDNGDEWTRVKTVGGWTAWVQAGSGTGGGGTGDYDPAGTADAVMADHLAAIDPHPQYLNDARGDARYDLAGTGASEAADAVDAHVAASDPHTQYHTDARGDARYDTLGTADAAVSDHVAAVDPHTQYLNTARGDARYDTRYDLAGTGAAEASNAVSAHVAATDPHTQYLNNTRGDARYDAINSASNAVSAHVAATDPHTQYLNNTRGDARYDGIGTADAAVAAHVGATDPHTQYLNNTRGDARYDVINAASSAVSAHVGAADPHTQYLNTTRGDARYLKPTPGPTVHIFDASGTWTKPAGCVRIKATIIGGGGGGGGIKIASNQYAAGAGGNSGAVCVKYLDVTSISSIPVTVGAGGLGGSETNGVVGNPGAVGGTSQLGTSGVYGIAPGGTGGSGRSLSQGGATLGNILMLPIGSATSASNGDINGGSNPGGVGFAFGNTNLQLSGVGGSGPFGGGAPGQRPSGSSTFLVGADGAGPGAGGSGAAVTANATQADGGDGFHGQVIIEEFYA